MVSEIINREKALNANKPKASDLPLELKFLDSNTAYLNAPTFDYDLGRYKLLLKDVFARIKSSGAETLILDLRSNTGGNSALGDALVDMFNAKPYQHFSMRWKKSIQYLERMKGENVSVPDYYLSLRPGEIYNSNSRIVQPAENPLRYIRTGLCSERQENFFERTNVFRSCEGQQTGNNSR